MCFSLGCVASPGAVPCERFSPMTRRSRIGPDIEAFADDDMCVAAAASINMAGYKWIIAVDDDIDNASTERVFWAMTWRVQPHRDIEIQRGRPTDLDPSAAPIDAKFTDRVYPEGLGGSQILIDATLKWAPNRRAE